MPGPARRAGLYSSDGIAALLWVAFGGFLFWQSFLLLGLEEASAVGIFGPAFYPRLLAVMIMVLGIVLAIQSLRRGKPGAVDAEAAPARSGLHLSIGAFIGLLIYTYLLDKIGYLLITPPMLLALMVLMGERRWLMMLIWAIGFSGGLYILFRYALRVILPEGLLY